MNEAHNENGDSKHDSSMGIPQTTRGSTTTEIDVSTSQLNGLYEWWLKTFADCPNNLTGFNEKRSTDGKHRNEHICRPNGEQLLHNLKQSLLWSNLTEMDNRSHEMLLHLSQNLLDNTFIEWFEIDHELSRRVRGRPCFSNHLTDSNLAQKLQSNEHIVSSIKTKTECNIKNASISDESLPHSTENFKEWTTMSARPTKHSTTTKRCDGHFDVLILGAGLAGLGAATALSKSQNNGTKCTYLVLEAQDEAGGRVKTCKLVVVDSYAHNGRITNNFKPNDSHLIDAGAQWLHGRHNQLYAVCERNRLLSAEQSEEGLGSFLYERGHQIDGYLVKKVDFFIGQLLSECEQFARDPTGDSAPSSVGHFLRERFGRFIDGLENADDKRCAHDLFEWHVRFQMIDNSCLTLDQLSAKYWGKYSFNGESCQAHYNFRNGFHTVVDCLIDELSNATAICCNKQVIGIEIHNNRTELNNNDTDKMSNICVNCSDGSVYTANHVLVTFSLGVLKAQHKKLFHPNLPAFMQTTIDSIGFETINKVFLEFDTQWWLDLDGIQFVFHQNNEEKKEWTHYLTGFDVLKPHHPNILLGWIGGLGAIQMESLSDKQIIEDCVNLLTKFTNVTVPYPTRYYCTRWHSNPYINGAYSYISTNCDHNDTISHKFLSQALTLDDFYARNGAADNDDPSNRSKCMPIVLFAGEACHDSYFSTAHGAFLSGIEQANRFLSIVTN